MTRRHAFTLVELLVVIAIIATLAGLLIPATSMVQSKMKDVKCSNNLRQVGTAMIAYGADKDDAFPSTLSYLFTDRAGFNLRGVESKLLVCPRDAKKGSDSTMGRGGPLQPDLHQIHEPGCSYLYQCSNELLDDIPSPYTLPAATARDWFFQPSYGRQVPLTDPVTWAEGKKNQQQFGNAPGSDHNVRGAPFPTSFFPIISCFWHNRWNDVNSKIDRKVVSVSWDGSVFWHIPFWEHQINDVIPLPP